MWVSGSGKGTLRKNLKNQGIENLEFLKSYVTREMRPGEENGDQYWFISKEEFEIAIEQNDFLEYEINHKVAYYGTKKSEVDAWLTAGKILMKEIDTKGLKQVIENHANFKVNFTSFFLDVSNQEMTRRYLERHPEGCENDIKNRLESASIEREQANKYCDYIIDASQSPEKVLEKVLQIIKK
jgi:guanylate kinase